MLKVEIDNNSGFCFGVVYAIEMAEDYLAENEVLYCLGDIVHNNKEVERLEARGLKIIQHEDLKDLREVTVLLRAHGEPPSTYETALANDITLIDASCPIVLKLQNRVRKAYDSSEQIVIFGKPGHAEVIGLTGQTRENAIIITTEDDLDKIDYSKPVTLFSQTTKSTKKFYEMKNLIQERARTEGSFHDTICRQVSNREPELKKFSAQFDTIVFVAGKKSSNGKVLYGVCKSINPQTYFVSDIDEINPEWLANSTSVGICGATSTPMWLMERVAEHIRGLEPAMA